MTMNSVENFLHVLRFQPAEYVPWAQPVKEISYHGANHEGFEWPRGDDSPVGSRWTDIWGTGWHKIHPGVMGMPVFNPLASPANLNRYHWPDPDDERICGRIYRMAEEFHREWGPGEMLMGASHRDTLWEKGYMLVGMENLMMYFLTEPEFAREVLHHIMDFQIGMTKHYLKVGVQFAQLGDDLGTQQGPLLGPRIVNEFLLPEYRRLIPFYKEQGVLIGFHCCGNLDSLLETFIDLGVDLLNPIQATANDLDSVRAATQGRMALLGGVSSAVTMDGPVERIEAEVRHRLKQVGQQGGYVCCPDQGMPYPPEHLAAVERAVKEWGRYPLQ